MHEVWFAIRRVGDHAQHEIAPGFEIGRKLRVPPSRYADRAAQCFNGRIAHAGIHEPLIYFGVGLPRKHPAGTLCALPKAKS